ncbi:sulfur carrier protein ThiS [Pseudonocardia sp.]|jgi:sulfur carrier protein|uniref:sulfur carrier protein ThiS n=1 Tax=Pseudonocardia sp. TaxID=60912 RepID=UPI003D0A8D42
MTVWINGSEHELGEGASVLDALDAMGAPRVGVAVAVDAEVVPKAEWGTTALAAGSRVEVLTAVQGG